MSARLARLRDERGFTLIELLITVSMLAVVLLAAFTALNTLTQDANVDQAYAQEIQDAQVGVARIAHDLREAYSITTATPDVIAFDEWTPQHVTEHVRYDCTVQQPNTSYNECTRVQWIDPAAQPNSSTGTPVLLRLENGGNAGITTYCGSNAVFHYMSASNTGIGPSCTEVGAAAAAINPVYVEVRALVPAKGYLTGAEAVGGLSHTTVIDAGAALRNVTLSN
jgi:prepilin-type N-terminal cleavage/methylation domain-containing protein